MLADCSSGSFVLLAETLDEMRSLLHEINQFLNSNLTETEKLEAKADLA